MAAAHVVDSSDEERHTPDAEDLWNESFYADFVHEDGTWGGWLRLGLYPNRQVAWWTTWIVGADRPGVCSVDYAVPVPAGTGLVAEGPGTRIDLDLRRPLEEFRIVADAPAELYEEPADVYAGQAGTPARLALDLTWTTDGSPYHYELTTRYEVPCTVRGTVTVDGTTLTVDGQGQRDHSWGVRDWWLFGWCWSSARLDDGTRIHLADIRIPGMPVAFGYVQAGGGVHPITGLTVTEELGLHDFPDSARIAISTEGPPGTTELDIALTPVAYGPLLLRDEAGGRTSLFPRALVRYAAADGRQGIGWVEWNQPELPPT